MEAQKLHTENKIKSLNHVFVSKLKKDLQRVNVKFLSNIKYKPSINKYCLEDIIKPYNKRKTEWLRLPSAITFMNKYPKLFTVVKKGTVMKTYISTIQL